METLLATSQDDFPLLDASGRLQGLLARADIVEALKNADASAPIAPFARKQAPTIDAGASLDLALAKLNEAGAIGVIDANGALLGLLTRQSVAEVMLIKAARPEWRFGRGAAGE